MQVLKDLLIAVLSTRKVRVEFVGLDTEGLTTLVDVEMFTALSCIQACLRNPENSDFQCVEDIVGIMEGINLDCGGRHDFG